MVVRIGLLLILLQFVFALLDIHGIGLFEPTEFPLRSTEIFVCFLKPCQSFLFASEGFGCIEKTGAVVRQNDRIFRGKFDGLFGQTHGLDGVNGFVQTELEDQYGRAIHLVVPGRQCLLLGFHMLLETRDIRKRVRLVAIHHVAAETVFVGKE